MEQTGRDSHKRARIHYSHTKVIDSFHKAPDSASKIRVTTEEKTGSVKECIVKSRVADLNIYCPKRNVDWRISVNTEIPSGSFYIPLLPNANMSQLQSQRVNPSSSAAKTASPTSTKLSKLTSRK